MEFKPLHDSENAVFSTEPHLRSFIPEKSDSEPEVAPVFEDIESEDQKDKTLTTVFILIGSLTLIAAVGYFITNKIEPTRTNIVSELYVSDSEITPEVSEQEDTGATYGSLEQDELVRKYKERLEEQRLITLNEETFAKLNQSSTSIPSDTPKYVVTETVVRASSTRVGTTTNRIQELTEVVNSTELGISFLKDPFWKQTIKGNSIILKDVGPTTKDTIIITRFKGTSVTTEDPKFGNVTYFYDVVNKTWMRIYHDGNLMLGQKVVPEMFTPFQTTKYMKPVFEGTGRYKTLIIAFSSEDFLIANINGTGYTSILDSFVREIRNIQ